MSLSKLWHSFFYGTHFDLSHMDVCEKRRQTERNHGRHNTSAHSFVWLSNGVVSWLVSSKFGSPEQAKRKGIQNRQPLFSASIISLISITWTLFERKLFSDYCCRGKNRRTVLCCSQTVEMVAIMRQANRIILRWGAATAVADHHNVFHMSAWL